MKNNYLLFFATLLLLFIQSQSKAQGGVSINTAGAAPANSAMLDVSSSNHGLLIPRVALDSLTDQTTIASPAMYLTVYNTNASVGNGTGMYYWNGNTWSYMASASNGNGSNGQVLTSHGTAQAPQWNSLPQTGGGGSICACFNSYQVFTSSGTFTTSSTTTLIKVQVWGGGGGGSGANTNYQGAGGGGGGYAEGIFIVTPSTNYNVVVGAGGGGGTPNGGSGSNGSPSNFDILISASGGGGSPFNNNNLGGAAGQGGVGTGGYLNTSLGSGGTGGYQQYFSGQAGGNNGGSPGGYLGGGGGAGLGGGNGGQYNASGNDAAANTGAGGGGAGSGTGTSGGSGANGLVVVYY